MEMLQEAYNISIKYGVTFYDFGPFLSCINDKIGICLELKEKKYGYLKRNFNFENLSGFESFIKRYAYYQNALKGKSEIIFNDYITSNPTLKFGYEIQSEQETKDELEQKKLIVNNYEELLLYVTNLFNDRVQLLEQRKSVHDEMQKKLLDYKKNLYAYYDRNLEQFSTLVDNAKLDYENFWKMFFEKYNSELQKIKNNNSLQLTKDAWTEFVNDCKNFEKDEKFFGYLFDIEFFKHNIMVIDKMNQFINEKLKSSKKNNRDDTKESLEKIKNSMQFFADKNQFIKNKIFEISQTNSKNIDEITNRIIKAPEQNSIVNGPKQKNCRERIITDLNGQFENLCEDDQQLLTIYFSPLRSMINDVLSNGENNQNENWLLINYESLYEEICTKKEISDNLFIFQKYFKNINLNSFEEFVSSILMIGNKIKEISMTLTGNLVLWTMNNNSIIKYCTFDVIKDFESKVDCLCMQANSCVLFSPVRIDFKESDENILVLKKENNIAVTINQNEFSDLNKIEKVIIYKYPMKKMQLENSEVNVVVDEIFDKECVYQYVLGKGK